MLEKNTRILIADEHATTLAVVQEACKDRTDIEILQIGCSEEALAENLQSAHGDVLIYGALHNETLSYATLSSVETLARAYPHIKIIVLASEADPVIVTRILAAGCAGFVSTHTALADLPEAIRETLEGCRYVDSSTTKRLIQHMFLGSPRQQMPSSALTPRESEVVEFFAQGMSVNEIAAATKRSVKTIHTQKQSAMRKLGVCNSAQLIDAFNYIQVN